MGGATIVEVNVVVNTEWLFLICWAGARAPAAGCLLSAKSWQYKYMPWGGLRWFALLQLCVELLVTFMLDFGADAPFFTLERHTF